MARPTNYASLTEYIDYINNTCTPDSRILTGAFYVYVYKFSLDYPNKILKFYDKMPLTFVTDTFTENGKSYFIGLNLHHMPVKERIRWYRRISLVIRVEQFIRLKRRIDRVTWLNYKRIVSLFNKSNLMARKYRVDRVLKLKKVPFNKVREMLNFYARTYYGVSIAEVSQKYFNEGSGK